MTAGYTLRKKMRGDRVIPGLVFIFFLLHLLAIFKPGFINLTSPERFALLGTISCLFVGTWSCAFQAKRSFAVVGYMGLLVLVLLVELDSPIVLKVLATNVDESMAVTAFFAIVFAVVCGGNREVV
jgi:hypothetical protein